MLVAVLAMPGVSADETSVVVPYAMSFEEPFSVRAKGYDYDHEVLISLPASYHTSPGKSYPVLWSMDGALNFAMTAGVVNVYVAGMRLPEMIVVGVGHPSEDGRAGFARRSIDFFPRGSIIGDPGPAEDYMKNTLGADSAALDPTLKGDNFLDFLVNQLRPALAEKYRMSDDHTLWGHSAGGAFTGYALFAQPGGFDRYIIGSGTNGLSLELEDEYAKAHDDLDAKVFLGAGDLEANNAGLSSFRFVSRTVILGETLRLRGYPSLSLQVKLYTDRDHFNVMPPLIGDGLEFVFAEEAAKIRHLMPW